MIDENERIATMIVKWKTITVEKWNNRIFEKWNSNKTFEEIKQ